MNRVARKRRTARRAGGRRFSLPAVLVATGLVLTLSGGASAEIIYEETFDSPSAVRAVGTARVVETEDGLQGFTVDRSTRTDFGGLILSQGLVTRLRGQEGTIEFWLQRRNSGDKSRGREPVLEFVDHEDRNILTVYIQWEGSEFGGGAELLMDSKRTADPAYDLNVWGEVIPLDFTPRAGEWIHVALTYGAAEGENQVLVNGKALTSAYPPVGSYAQVRSTEMGKVTMKNGRLDLSGVTEVRVGAEGKDWDKGIGRGVRYLENSILDDLRFHDTVVTSFDLARIGAAEGQPEILSVEHNGVSVAGFSLKLVAGDTMTVALEGTAGATATFDIVTVPDIKGKIELSWQGYGVYLEEITFFDEGEINLRDVEEYRVFVSREPIAAVTEEMEPVEVLEVQAQSYTIEGLEADVPYYTAVVAVMDDGSFQHVIRPHSGLSMSEDPESPGKYEGAFVVDYRDRYPVALVVGHLSRGDAQATMVGDEQFEIDASLTIIVHASPQELEADEESKSTVLVTVTDANEEAVAGHEIGFILATTSQFTGVVGGGQFADEVGGSLRRDFWGETDLFGQVTATYTAGFAAKTAIIVARDMLSNDTGAGYVKTFIRARAEVELEAVQQVAGKALGYSIVVTSSDEWLTADGESTARITAFVSRDGIPAEGHRVSFRVTAGSGSIRTVSGTTDNNGKARAIFTAGTKIGVVLITAIDQNVGISGVVRIELRSDAPAKIAITVVPDILPADGRSKADLEVLVTDINDNPNEGIEVEYVVAIGQGRLRSIEELTDEDGISTAEFVAGRIPGKAIIEVTVRSTVPTEEELTAARALALAVTDYSFF
jgi:hypothetical protein